VQGIRHPGFAFIQLLSPCVTFVGRDQFDIIRALGVDLAPDYDPSSPDAAWQVSQETGKISFGVIYRKQAPTYQERFAQMVQIAKQEGAHDFNAVLRQYHVSEPEVALD